MKKIIILTGSTGGIGQSILRTLLKQENLFIVLLGRNINAMKNLCYQNKEKVAAYYLDLEDIHHIEKTYLKIKKEFDTPEVIINCAGIAEFGPVTAVNSIMLERIIRINLIGTIILTKMVIQDMIEKCRGQIINIESISAIKGIEYCTCLLYTSFKQADSSHLHILWQRPD